MAQQLKWQLGTVIEIRQETPNVKSLILDLPECYGAYLNQVEDSND